LNVSGEEEKHHAKVMGIEGIIDGMKQPVKEDLSP
jgi:hypothetical protein